MLGLRSGGSKRLPLFSLLILADFDLFLLFRYHRVAGFLGHLHKEKRGTFASSSPRKWLKFDTKLVCAEYQT
jgi:hypothetical protein